MSQGRVGIDGEADGAHCKEKEHLTFEHEYQLPIFDRINN